MYDRKAAARENVQQPFLCAFDLFLYVFQYALTRNLPDTPDPKPLQLLFFQQAVSGIPANHQFRTKLL